MMMLEDDDERMQRVLDMQPDLDSTRAQYVPA